ncbi:MAG: isoprenylcysteine carboxylmethyltransferase family protein [Opitutaceae bacterium]
MKELTPHIAVGGGGTAWVFAQMLQLAALAIIAPWRRGHWPPALSLGLGAVLMIYAAWTGLSGVRRLGRNRTSRPEPRAGGELVTTGIYARLRHPLNASMMAMGCGWAVLWSSAAGLVLTLALTLFLHAKTRLEENLLRARFAGYDDYSRRVPRYLPRPFKVSHS